MSAISSPVRAVLELFGSELADVRFGDVDAQTLSRVAADVESAAEVVTAAQAALEGARATLNDRQETLLLQTQRALAYARVYAEADEALSSRLEAITLPRAARRARTGETNANGNAMDALVLSADPQPAPRPRGRPRKVPVTAVSALNNSHAEEPMLEGLSATGE